MDNTQRLNVLAQCGKLRHGDSFLAAILPLIAIIALGGGYVLVKRALSPVDQIATSAERISSNNLSERLPIAQTGDELERLSVALNHMIERLVAAFQYSRRFVADASHELRTPLTVIQGELESLVQQRELNPDWRDRLGSALEEVERLADHIVVMDHGKVIAADTLDGLQAGVGGGTMTLESVFLTLTGRSLRD